MTIDYQQKITMWGKQPINYDVRKMYHYTVCIFPILKDNTRILADNDINKNLGVKHRLHNQIGASGKHHVYVHCVGQRKKKITKAISYMAGKGG